ncbi:uncharacterized protein LOC143174875 [Nomia melanderi]|uniref:uncharacterized protein LOC143174875 n=1 Tax=Nomia melanderi TaxID=2448451 RepID=UPI003FCD5A35
MEKEPCELCSRGHTDRSSCTITTCTWPLLNIDRPKDCQEYYPPIKRIKAVRFIQPANTTRGYAPWTNLMYRPIIQVT